MLFEHTRRCGTSMKHCQRTALSSCAVPSLFWCSILRQAIASGAAAIIGGLSRSLIMDDTKASVLVFRSYLC